MVFIIMGVSGCGKTTIGKMLAERIALPFFDADDFHPQHNIDKMKQTIALTDDDRVSWLNSLAQLISESNRGEGAVLACSALKEKYRAILSQGGEGKVLFVYLKGSMGIIQKRMEMRKGHFMQSALLENQFDILEEPRDAVTVSIDPAPEQICGEIINVLAGRGLIRAAL
jgi:gluconokinase